MSERNHCKLRVSTFSVNWTVKQWLFGDFLKYSKNDLVSQKPEVVIETVDQEIKLNNLMVLNRPNHIEPKPPSEIKYLGDAARLAYIEKADRQVLDLHLSSDLWAVVEDDIKAGNNIHIFDLEFKNEYQTHKEFSVKGQSASLSDDFDKIKKPKLNEKICFRSDLEYAIFVAKIISHRSLLDEYVETVESNPVWREASNSTLILECMTLQEEIWVGKYLDRFREECDVLFKQTTLSHRFLPPKVLNFELMIPNKGLKASS